jgi:hypothetical protein
MRLTDALEILRSISDIVREWGIESDHLVVWTEFPGAPSSPVTAHPRGLDRNP